MSQFRRPRRRTRALLLLWIAAVLALAGCGEQVNREDGAVYRIEGLDHPAELRFYGSTYITTSPGLSEVAAADFLLQVESPCAPAHAYLVTMENDTVEIVDHAPESWLLDWDVPGGCGGLESSSLDFQVGAMLTFVDDGMIVLPDETVVRLVYLGSQAEVRSRALEDLD